MATRDSPEPSDAPLYYQSPLLLARADSEKAIILDRHGCARVVDRLAAQALHACQGLRSVDQHAHSVAQAGLGLDFRSSRVLLRDLIRTGLLLSVRLGIVSTVGMPLLRVQEITTVVIVTADRPRLLQRCIRSCLRHCREHHRSPHIVVIDGSQLSENVAANRTVARTEGKDTDCEVTYCGESDLRPLRQLLSQADVEPDLIARTLTPGSVGANRNIALLLTAGLHFLMVDDDVILEPWTFAESTDTLEVSGHVWPQRTEFFSSRCAALTAAGRSTQDLFDAHEQLLGHRVSALLEHAPEVDCRHACGHILSRLGSVTQTVRTTASGVAGDSGTYCPYTHLFSSGPTLATLLRDHESQERALQSREVRRATVRRVITHHKQFIAACVGIANTSAVPPFMTAGRNEDGAFAAVLAAIEPDAVFGHVPYGIVHDSTRPAQYDSPVIRSASETRLADIMLDICQMWGDRLAAEQAPDRLAELSRIVKSLGTLEHAELAARVAGWRFTARVQQLNRLDEMLHAPKAYPTHWRAALERFRRTLLERIAEPGFFCPVEFVENGGASSIGRLAAFLEGFGDLTRAWPALWSKAIDIQPLARIRAGV